MPTTPGDEERKHRILANGLECLRRLHGDQTWEDWMGTGEAMMVITEDALAAVGATAWDKDNKRLVKEFNRRWDEYEAGAGSNQKPLSKQERASLRFVMTNPEVGAFRAGLMGPDKRRLNHPNAVVNRWRLSLRARDTRTTPSSPKREVKVEPDIDHNTLAKELAQAKARIAELERVVVQTNERHEDRHGLARTTASGRARPAALTEEVKLRAENTRLRRQINLLRPMVDGEVVKLRKEVEALRGERASLHRALKQAAKERDRNHIIHSSPLLRVAAGGKLKRATYRKIVQCLHHDSRRARTEAQLDEAAVLFIELEDLFQFEPK
jgi:hypothetical protein